MRTRKPLRLALFGGGRMGQRHAENLATIAGGELAWVCDANLAAAEALAGQQGCRASADLDEVMAAGDFDAVIIATPTETHIDLIAVAARAGKAILCEKPIDNRLDRIEACQAVLAQHPVPLQIAFNRRYDVGHSALAQAVRAGEIGDLRFCALTSRDWMPPPAGYIERSGGIFHDMMIHDFDMIRFITGEEPVAVQAAGSALFVDEAVRHDDVDTAAVILTLASGAICQINCLRSAVYGHDQRIEAVGSDGMLISQNRTIDHLERYTADFTGARAPFIASSRDRYREAYRAELADFILRVEQGLPPAVTFEDGYRAMLVAEAAKRAWLSGAAVPIE